MANIKMYTEGGIGKGNTMPLEGTVHGEIFEYLGDNTITPQLFSWNDISKEWRLIGGVSSGETYKNATPMNISVGGYGIGTSFPTDKTVVEMLDGLLYPYTLPSVSLSMNPSASVKEYGNPISSVILSANITKKSNDIVKIEYYKNGSLIKTNTSLVNGNSVDTYTDSTGVNSTTTYSVKLYDSKPNSVTSSSSFTYVYPMYIGSVTMLNPTETDIKSMTKKIVTKSNQSMSYTISSSRFCFAYPSSYGNIVSIKDPNNFEMINSFTKTVSTFTMLDGLSVSYNIYTLSGQTSQTGFTVTYSF